MMTVQIWNCLLLRRKEHGSSLHSDAILKEIGKKVLRELDTDRIDPHKDVIKENWIHIFFFFVANNSYLNHHYLEADSSAGGASVQARAKSHREYRHICPISCCWLANLSLIWYLRWIFVSVARSYEFIRHVFILTLSALITYTGQVKLCFPGSTTGMNAILPRGLVPSWGEMAELT